MKTKWMKSTVPAAVLVLLLVSVMLSAAVSGEIDETNTNSYGLDTNSNTLYDFLVVEVHLWANVSGNYYVSIGLSDKYGEMITSNGSIYPLDVGTNVVDVYLEGSTIHGHGVDGPYNATIYAYDMNFTDFMMGNHVTSAYSYTDFEMPPAMFAPPHSDYGLDTDSPADGTYDQLVVDVQVDVQDAGWYEVDGSLEKGWDGIGWTSNYTYLDAGLQTVGLWFDGQTIYASGYDGPYNVSLRLYDDGWDLISSDTHVTQSYSHTDFDPSSSFAPPHSDYGLDTDGNGTYDHLVVDVQVDVQNAGWYRVEGELRKGWSWIDWTSNYTYLDTGLQTVGLWFDGEDIYDSGEDGPYNVTLSLEDDNWNNLDTDNHITQSYSYTDFDAPPTQAPDAYEPDDNYTQASPITVNGANQSHNFHVDGDVDWVYFAGTIGVNHTIETYDLGWSCDTTLSLYDSDGGTLIDYDDDGGSGLASKIEFTPNSTGPFYVQVRLLGSGGDPDDTYYLKVFSAGGGGGGSGADDIVAPEVVSTDPDDGDVGVDPETTFEVKFSMDMDHSSVEDALSCSGSTTITQLAWSGDDTLRFSIDGLDYGEIYTVTISAGAESSTGVNMDSSHSFSFTVLDDLGTVTGAVKDASGEPLVGAKVQAYDKQTNDPIGMPSTTDSEGKYTLLLPPGDYYIKISKEGFETIRIKDVTVVRGETTQNSQAMLEPGSGSPSSTIFDERLIGVAVIAAILAVVAAAAFFLRRPRRPSYAQQPAAQQPLQVQVIQPGSMRQPAAPPAPPPEPARQGY